MYKKMCCTCKVVVVIFFLLILSYSKTGNNCFATLLQYELNRDVVPFYHRRSNLSCNKNVSSDLLIFLPFSLRSPFSIRQFCFLFE